MGWSSARSTCQEPWSSFGNSHHQLVMSALGGEMARQQDLLVKGTLWVVVSSAWLLLPQIEEFSWFLLPPTLHVPTISKSCRCQPPNTCEPIHFSLYYPFLCLDY